MTPTEEMRVAIQWQSHLPALLACIAVTDGPVLELGIGHFSTPHLHALCLAMKRNLVSVEHDAEWYSDFKQYEFIETGRFSHMVYCGNYMEVLTTSGISRYIAPWGVAFIDSSPGGKGRSDLFKHLIEISDYVVVHDAQKDAENFQHIEPMLDGVNWYLCTSIWPHTLVCSKTKQIPAVLLGM